MKSIAKALCVTGLLLVLTACGQDAPKADTDDPQYKLGYEAGLDDGKAQTCAAIGNYKDSIAEALKTEGICP